MVENEDLRDRLGIITQQDGTSIDYMPYLAHKSLEKSIQRIQDPEELSQVKNMMLTHVFSLRKDNRHLQRRIQNFEDKYQERKAKKRMSRQYNHSRQSSIMTDHASTKHLETENSIDMYPELGPNKAALLVQEEKVKAN